MRRRLPVIQPTAIERRAFLLGLMGGAIAACSDDGGDSKKFSSSSGSSTSSSGGTKDAGGSSSGDGGGSSSGDAGGSSSGSTSGGFDSGIDSGTSGGPKGCLAVGKEVGPPSSFAMGTVTMIASQLVIIGRDAGGLYAMYFFCTHSTGNLVIQGNQLRCTNHGALFTFTGDLVSGPGGTFALPHYQLCINSKGNVAVDTNTIVPASTRLVA